MSDVLKTCAKSVFEKMNLFVIFQVVWIIEFHILAVFSVNDWFDGITGEQVKVPAIIGEYSQKIANWMDTYNIFVFFMGIVLIIIGISGAFLKTIPVLNRYKIICTYSDFGFYAGGWFLLIHFTYSIYLCMGRWFLLAPIIAYILYSRIRKLNEWLESKGITFSR
ncbi:MAG: hypothetical protein IJ419_15980 [Agathobacter sp.]|nr:hypothetical protein [Agathobacter sp.]